MSGMMPRVGALPSHRHRLGVERTRERGRGVGELQVVGRQELEAGPVGTHDRAPDGDRLTGSLEVVAVDLAVAVARCAGGVAERAQLGRRLGDPDLRDRRDLRVGVGGHRWDRDGRAALVAVVGRHRRMALRADGVHHPEGWRRLVFTEPASSARSSSASTCCLSRTVPVAASSMSTTAARPCSL